ncbi:restriction endonuclease [Vibrio parahaemolyticus]|uniref:restriction endonuclease n=1 Tax=Vibrio parahaemolyticus TaxID=670 RepID=UPI000870CDA1|nr:restriction endonuclease [Vibrio parahaemolyticus]AOV92374.1 hypothetical protein FORC23_3831 [Vibrio parahaemolyticus]MDF4643246.1 restriction endonuclease [Vibrio parahaemolyticus]HCG6849967.1 restriction endonuclease [Vibrio parahaemolyticus]
MAVLSQTRMRGYIRQGQVATTTKGKGDAFEELLSYAIGKVSGISVTRRNVLNDANSEEVDIAFFNEQKQNGFFFLPNFILAECKNWSKPLGSIEVNWFDTKLKNRGLTFGILFAANGISGDAVERTAARDVISNSLKEGRDIVVITEDELLDLANTDELCNMIKEKICDLKVSGTVI